MIINGLVKCLCGKMHAQGGITRTSRCPECSRDLWARSMGRIPLDELPQWAQDMIVSTGLGILEDENAFAMSDAGSFTIHAHGYTYRASRMVPFIH